MRITNKIMQRNNLSNINTNKIYQDKLSTQMSTQKKVNRPSDDPVVAIRALRLRSNVTEITQYYSKNIPDAESWLNVTEDALKNLTSVVTSMIAQCTKGANGDLKSTDREIVLEQLKALSAEIYSTGDVDYAGRYVFTGYRTDTSLSFAKEETIKYEISEQLDSNALEQMTMVNTDKVLDINSSNFASVNVSETDISAVDVYRIRLAYDDCAENGTPSISFGKQVDPVTGAISFATTWTTGAEIQMMHSYEDPYTEIAKPENETKDMAIYVPETGELLLSKKSYETLMAVKDDITTSSVNEGEIKVTYQKDHWVSGNLRPEHYFYCKTDAGTPEEIVYNNEYLKGNPEKQVIEYDVGFNQTIRVNSTADECFEHGIGREVDDLVDAMQQVVDLEKVKTEIEKLLETAVGTDATTLQTQLDATDKALTLSKDKCQKMFESSITDFQGYLDKANLCITNCGTRSSKLELIKNRMQNQKTTFETLKSENEDIDITEVAIQLNSAELTYEAALMAAGKVMQTTLLNFI